MQDLLAICGGRDYVFFLDAAVVERFSQLESLYGYLLEEADLGAEAGGKLRKAILTGFQSVYCMSAVRSMAVIADVWLWPMLRAIEPGPEVHILDVCPVSIPVYASPICQRCIYPCVLTHPYALGSLAPHVRMAGGGGRGSAERYRWHTLPVRQPPGRWAAHNRAEADTGIEAPR